MYLKAFCSRGVLFPERTHAFTLFFFVGGACARGRARTHAATHTPATVPDALEQLCYSFGYTRYSLFYVIFFLYTCNGSRRP